jgi:hypothetical protein
MKLEDQVCSLELAKRLKELGVKQESYFYWECDRNKKYPPNVAIGKYDESRVYQYFSAFTVAELGEMLPRLSSSYRSPETDPKHPKLFDGLWKGCHKGEKISSADTEANARAKMLIHLIETKIIKGEA